MRLAGWVVLGVLLGLSACNSQPKEASPSLTEEIPLQAEAVKLVVHGLSCPMCATNVDKKLQQLPGVKSVKVNLGDGTILVGLASIERPTRSQLAEVVSQSGYSLIRIETP